MTTVQLKNSDSTSEQSGDMSKSAGHSNRDEALELLAEIKRLEAVIAQDEVLLASDKAA